MNDFSYDTPPQAPDVERAVLSAMLFEREAIDIASESIGKVECFYKPANALIYRTCLELYIQNAPVDQLTVTERLREKGVLYQCGGEAHIAGLGGEITGAANVAYHCGILKEKAILRKVIAVTTSVSGMCHDPAAKSADIINTLQGNILLLQDKRGEEKSCKPISEYMTEAYTTIIRRNESDKVTGVPSGITRLDWVIDGFQNGDLYLLAGRPGEGKSALAGQIAMYAAENGYPTGVFALEMKGRDYGIRFMAAKARRNLSPRAIRQERITENEWMRLGNACSQISKYPLYIDQTTGLSISQVYARTRQMIDRYRIKFLMVDYLQLMSGEGGEENREKEVSHISRGLKGIAKNLNIPVLALSQLSRKAVDSDFKRPRLSDLRESGALEQDADAVMFIYDPDPKVKEKMNFRDENGMDVTHLDGVRVIIVEKDRQGEIGDVWTYWKKEHVSFHNLEY